MAGGIGLRPDDAGTMAPVGTLSREQRVLAHAVCEQYRRLDLRIQALAHAVWSGKVTRVDGAAVYAWLVALDLADQVNAVFRLADAA
jgi:hypothetical protein